MRGRLLLLAIAVGAACASVALAQAPDDQRARLAEAKAQSAAAAARSAKLEQQAVSERDQAQQARAQEAAVAARIQQAEADIAAGQARLAIIDRLLGEQRGRLAAKQAPVVRLMAALQSHARRPAIISASSFWPLRAYSSASASWAAGKSGCSASAVFNESSALT